MNAIERRQYPAARRKGQGTPLHAAIATQDVERLQLLLAEGADLEGRNTLGQTAQEYAAERGFVISEGFLRDAVATVGQDEVHSTA